MIAELSDKGALGEKFIEYLIAQELKDNSKWVISNGERADYRFARGVGLYGYGDNSYGDYGYGDNAECREH